VKTYLLLYSREIVVGKSHVCRMGQKYENLPITDLRWVLEVKMLEKNRFSLA